MLAIASLANCDTLLLTVEMVPSSSVLLVPTVANCDTLLLTVEMVPSSSVLLVPTVAANAFNDAVASNPDL